MWKFFGKSEEAAAEHDKPDLTYLNDGKLLCDSCGTILDLETFIPLSVGRCVKCDTPFFVPYFVKEYWLYKPLGGGGMGSVYKSVFYHDPSQEFAVKLLPREKLDDVSLINALMGEAEIGSSFGAHPHLAQVVDYGEYEGEYFSVLEFVKGNRLDEIIESSEKIDQRYVLLWALQILSAEQRMYDVGYLYRDLKPQNIIVDQGGNAMLIDYGLCVSAEVAAQGATSDSVEGSPLYMPPERITGDPEYMCSEIYSLGMVMFHALTKKTYYSASGAYELARKHVMSLRLAGVSSKLPQYLHPSISPLLDNMIARNQQERYQTYKQCGADVKTIFDSL